MCLAAPVVRMSGSTHEEAVKQGRDAEELARRGAPEVAVRFEDDGRTMVLMVDGVQSDHDTFAAALKSAILDAYV